MTLVQRNKMDWQTVRELFPATKTYTYLNSAAAPPLSLYAAREGKRYYEEMLQHGDIDYDRWVAQTEEVREKLARLLHAEANQLAFTYSSSHGMNLVAQILAKRGEVLAPADEFPSATLPWLQQGYKIHFVASRERGIIELQDIAAAVGPRTRILVASYVQYATGFRQDLFLLGQLCQERDLVFVVDATQAMGVFPIDVAACGIDFLVFSGYKWALAGYGVGGLYISPRFLDTRKFPVAGWWSAHDPEAVINNRLDLKDTAAELEVGCPHFAGIFALGGALDLFAEIGADRIERRVQELMEYLHARVTDAGLKIVSPSNRNQRSGITVIETTEAQKVVQALAEKKIIVSARGKGIRVSAHMFNNFEDFDRLMPALIKIL
jgi:cysteine desulfurase/selenocysteine lyase